MLQPQYQLQSTGTNEMRIKNFFNTTQKNLNIASTTQAPTLVNTTVMAPTAEQYGPK